MPREYEDWRIVPGGVGDLVTALRDFVECIEATNGVFYDENGNTCPYADPDWTDLGDAYLQACRVLGRTPMLDEDEQEPETNSQDD